MFKLIKEDVERASKEENKTLTLKDKHGNVVATGKVDTSSDFIDKYSVELMDFEIHDNEHHDPLKVGQNFMGKFWEKVGPKIQRVYVEDGKYPQFWRKLGFTHVNNNYFFLDKS